MPHVVTTPPTPFGSRSGRLQVRAIPAASDNLVWLIVGPDGREAAVVDGPDAGATLAACAELGARLTTLLTTHTHGDHVGIHHDLQRKGLLAGMRVIGCGERAADIPGLTEPVDEGASFELFGARVEVLRTEGHMNGHLSYVVDGLLFCGDTMFGGGCGYLFDGPPAAMHASLQRLAALPADTAVCCAHEYTQDNLRFAWTVDAHNPELRARIAEVWARRERGETTLPSTIGLERATNPFLRGDDPRLVAAVAAALPSAALDDAVAVFAATRACKDTRAYKALGDSHLPL
jgi:hydroxyacylglutathione hydrolase